MGRVRASIGLLLVLGAGLLSACGETVGEAKQLPHAVVTERDFHISHPRHVAPGPLQLTVDNRGPDAHELILVRGRASSLPDRNDGLTVDEDALANREAGSLEPANPGASRTLDVDLKPGRYVMFCNMYGHFDAGMHTDLVVR